MKVSTQYLERPHWWGLVLKSVDFWANNSHLSVHTTLFITLNIVCISINIKWYIIYASHRRCSRSKLQQKHQQNSHSFHQRPLNAETLLIDIQNSDKALIIKSWNNLCGGKTKHVTVSVCVDVDVDMPILCWYARETYWEVKFRPHVFARIFEVVKIVGK